MMKEPQISDFSLSDEIYQLIKLEHSDNLTDKYMLIYAYKEPKRKLRNRIITIILLAIIAALIFMACRHFELSIFSSICLLLILLYPIGIGIVIILGVIDKHLVENPTDEIKQNIVKQFYYKNITSLDRKHFWQYKDAIIAFRRQPVPIKWSDIIFKDGEILFIIKVFDGEYTFEYDDSIDIYDDYKNIVIALLPIIYVYLQDEKVHIKNTDDFDTAIEIIISRYKKDRQLLQQYNSTNQDSIKSGIQSRGTEYMKYLLNRQVNGLGVIKDKEMLMHAIAQNINYEPAYVFTLLSKHGNRYIVVYENMNTDAARASIICDVPIDEYSSYIPCIISYMGRERIANRRQTLHKTHEVKGYSISHAQHGDFLQWKNKIEGVSKARRIYTTYTRTTYKRKKYKRWRRWY